MFILEGIRACSKWDKRSARKSQISEMKTTCVLFFLGFGLGFRFNGKYFHMVLFPRDHS